MDGINEPQKTFGGRGTLTLFLSVYLLVLAFFILLNSIASYEEVKAKAVMESLSTTFADFGPGGTTDPFVANFGDLAAARAFQQQMTRVFEAAIPAAQVSILRPGRLMQVELDAASLFLDDKAAIRPGQLPLLDRIVAALSAPPPGLRHELEFVIGAPPGADGALPIGETPQVARAGAFAREMLARGAPPQALTAGLRLGSPERVRLLFRTLGEDEGRAPALVGD